MPSLLVDMEDASTTALLRLLHMALAVLVLVGVALVARGLYGLEMVFAWL